MHRIHNLNILQCWQRRFGGRGRNQPRAGPQRTAAMTYLVRGPVSDDLIDIRHLLFLVLYDGHKREGSDSIWLAGFSGTRIPWGVKWGGYKQNRFLKDVRLAPAPEARGRNLDLNDLELLHVALRLERQRVMRSRRQLPSRHLQLPRLWAGFDPSNAVQITGQGPELADVCERAGLSPDRLLAAAEREHVGLILYPLEWVSHHWRKVGAIFASLDGLPRYQVFRLRSAKSDLRGFNGAAEFDFYTTRFGNRRRVPASARHRLKLAC